MDMPLRPVPRIRINLRYELNRHLHNRLHPFNVTIFSFLFSWQFSFFIRHFVPARRFIQFCHFTLFKLRQYSVLKQVDVTCDAEYVLQPLLRIITEIITKQKEINFEPAIPDLTHDSYLFTQETFLPRPNTIDFLKFLEEIKKNLETLHYINDFEFLKHKLNWILLKLDTAYCMVFYFTNYYTPLAESVVRRRDTIHVHKLEEEEFMQYYVQISKRPDFRVY